MTALQDGLQVPPTAMTVPSLSAVLHERPTPLGVLTRLQLVPFQCSVKLPMAQMLVAETAAIPSNRLLTWFDKGFTVGLRLQLEPSQCQISANESGCSPLLDPATQTLIGESTVTASPRIANGVGTWLQVWPFQCRTILLVAVTAQTSLLESAEIP